MPCKGILVPRGGSVKRVKPVNYVKVAWHRGGPSHTSVARRGGSMRNRHQPWGAHTPPHGNAGPPAPLAQLCTRDMAPPLGPPPRRLPEKHGADAVVWTSVQLVQPCKLQGAPKEHTTRGSYLVRGGNSHSQLRQGLPSGLRPWRSLPQGLPRYSDAVAPPNRSTSREKRRSW